MSLLLCLCLTIQTSAAAQTTQTVPAAPAPAVVRRTLNSAGKQRTYYLFVPACAAEAKPVPLVMLLHPSGGDGQYLIKLWQELATRECFVLVGPDANNSDHWSAPVDGPDFLHDVAEAVRAERALDPRRIYLFGFSAGAGFSINMSLLESEYFAATAAYASITFKDQFADIAARKLPFSFTVGVKDEIFSVADARRARDALRARGFPIEWQELKDAGHNYATNAPAVNQAAWEFFKQHPLKREPAYRVYQFRQ